MMTGFSPVWLYDKDCKLLSISLYSECVSVGHNANIAHEEWLNRGGVYFPLL